MFRTIQRPAVFIAILLVAAATLYAIHDDKVANLLIGAAMVASSAAVFSIMMDRRLGDAYDTGRLAQLRSLLREHTTAKDGMRD